MKDLMNKAHKMTREIKAEFADVDYKTQLGLCMKYLLNNKEEIMVELKGTEKQVAWANELREKFINKLETLEYEEFFISIMKVIKEDNPQLKRRDRHNIGKQDFTQEIEEMKITLKEHITDVKFFIDNRNFIQCDVYAKEETTIEDLYREKLKHFKSNKF